MSREWSRVREPQQSHHASANALTSTSDGYDSLLDEDILLKPKKTWWRRRRWQVIIMIVVVALILIKVVPSFLNPAGPQLLYQYQKVTQGDLSLAITATGPVQGKVYNVDFENSGKLKEIDVKPNQLVKANQLLAKLDSTLLQDEVNQALQNVTQSEGDSQALADAQVQLKAAQDKLNSATLTAPHAGTVTAINGTVGSVPGASAAQSGGSSSFIQITDEAALQVQAYVNEADVGRVSKGQGAQFTVSAYGQQSFHGTVDSVSSTGVVVSNVVTYPMTINIDMKRLQGATLFPGMTADVTVQTLKHSNVLLIPQSTVNVIHTAVAHNFINQDQVNVTTAEAKRMLAASGSASTKDAPMAACVLVLEEKQWMLKPVLLGLTDGAVYEVIQGLAVDQTIMTDIQNSSNARNTLAFITQVHIKQ